MALTGGGPGTASDVLAIFMYQFSFSRGQLGVGAASAVMMLMTIIARDGACAIDVSPRRVLPRLHDESHCSPCALWAAGAGGAVYARHPHVGHAVPGRQ